MAFLVDDADRLCSSRPRPFGQSHLMSGTEPRKQTGCESHIYGFDRTTHLVEQIWAVEGVYELQKTIRGHSQNTRNIVLDSARQEC